MIMSKKKSKNKKVDGEKWHHSLKDETKHSIFGIISIVFGLFFTLASFGKAGIVGGALYGMLQTLFGAGFFLVPTVLFLAAIPLISSLRPHFLSSTFIGAALFLISSLGAADVMFGAKTGGYIGFLISWPLLKFFDFWASLAMLTALFIISLLIILNTSISIKIRGKEKERPAQTFEEAETPATEEIGQKIITSAKEIMEEIKKEIASKKKGKKNEREEEFEIETKKVGTHVDFTPPPINLLENDKGKPSSGDIKANANIIKRTLQNFGIDVEMGEINIGPSVTQHTLKPAEGIKLSRIVALQNDLSLALATHPLRIEAPIPGRALVGVEIPNSAKTLVGLAGLFSEEAFEKSNLPLLLALGRDVSGKSVFANLSKMPHLLISRPTGAGKSICIHSIIISLLYRNSPESLRFIMIDPKRVELTVYNKIPHMLTPVITDAKKSILTLKWACREMEKRYETLLKAGVRDIGSYHEKNGDYNSMPYLMIIIDELADLMATYPREMEASIVRLAQMSRAVGIHLIVSTQRPSVEVITGLIKANITSRIALQVASQIDSRTILDMSGAEKLLGKGDMLYLAGDTAKPRRIQGPFISEKEVKQVVKYLAEEYKDVDLENVDEEIEDVLAGAKAQSSLDFDEGEGGDDDKLYEEARELVIKTGKASSSYLQRRLKVGYARAARLLDMLEERGVVGPGEGAKPREVFMKENPQENEE